MRRFPGWAWLLLAVGFAVVASVMALGWLQRQAAIRPPVKAKPILVVRAKTQVEPDVLLNAGQLVTVVWDQKTPPQDFFANPQQVVGRVTRTALKPRDLITRENTREKRSGITAELSPHQRAMTVKVDEASGVAGFLAPGDRVDVLVTVNKGEYGKDPISKLLLQNLKVLGTGQRLEYSPGDKPHVVPTVTLEVSPQAGERLALAAQEGRISLVLRGQGDQALVETGGVNALRLFGKPAKSTPETPPAPPPTPPRRTVEVIRGIERQPATF